MRTYSLYATDYEQYIQGGRLTFFDSIFYCCEMRITLIKQAV